MQGEQPSDNSPTMSISIDPVPTLLIALWVVLAPLLIQAALAARTPDAIQQVAGTVDPNRAPWWELTILPRIGPTTSRAIVAHRKSRGIHQPPGALGTFAVPDDLRVIRGVGPVTVRRIAGELTFGETGPVTPPDR